MTAALEGGEWSAARPGRTLPPGRTQYPFYRRLGGLQGQSGRAESLEIKLTRCTNFSNLFLGIKLYVFRTVPTSIIKSFSLNTQQIYVVFDCKGKVIPLQARCGPEVG